MSERVLVEVTDSIAHVQLNRAEKRNGLDLAMFQGIDAAIRSLEDRSDVRAVVLSGVGSVFCAGLDFMSFMAAGPAGMKALLVREGIANLAQQVSWGWRELPMPVIAAVQGAAIGGGFQIALGADIVYVTPQARFSVREMQYGIIPDMGITQTLLKSVPLGIARELIYTGRFFEGTEAVSLGIANRACENPLEAAFDTARQIAERSPHAIRAAKKLTCEAPSLDTAAALLLETELQLPLLGSPNQLEAVQATFAKRTPNFTDPSA